MNSFRSCARIVFGLRSFNFMRKLLVFYRETSFTKSLVGSLLMKDKTKNHAAKSRGHTSQGVDDANWVIPCLEISGVSLLFVEEERLWWGLKREMGDPEINSIRKSAIKWPKLTALDQSSWWPTFFSICHLRQKSKGIVVVIIMTHDTHASMSVSDTEANLSWMAVEVMRVLSLLPFFYCFFFKLISWMTVLCFPRQQKERHLMKWSTLLSFVTLMFTAVKTRSLQNTFTRPFLRTIRHEPSRDELISVLTFLPCLLLLYWLHHEGLQYREPVAFLSTDPLSFWLSCHSDKSVQYPQRMHHDFVVGLLLLLFSYVLSYPSIVFPLPFSTSISLTLLWLRFPAEIKSRIKLPSQNPFPVRFPFSPVPAKEIRHTGNTSCIHRDYILCLSFAKIVTCEQPVVADKCSRRRSFTKNPTWLK